ncbi:MAG TPA: hypothetical protein VI977_01815 [archaeon]|nr:hypothetical protein [archaeon]
MQKRFYLDTSIWRDYFEDRQDNIRPLGEFAFQFLQKCLKEKNQIIVSDIVLRELAPYFSDELIQGMLGNFIEIIVKVEHTQVQAEEARAFGKKAPGKFPLFDILHAIISRDSNAILVSRDKHFAELSICAFGVPEEFL